MKLEKSLVLVSCVLVTVACGCGTTAQDQSPEPVERDVDVGDVSKIRAKPIRWNDGTVWNFHWLFTDYERFKQCVETDDYLQAEDDGVAYRLAFGTGILLTSTEKPIPKWWAVDFEVEVLDGPHAGKTGWIDFDALHDFYKGQRP